MTRPRLSFCIATFNRATFLATMLESVIEQAADDCEIVVCDNASTDDTRKIVADFSSRFGRLRYFRQNTNVGPDRNYDHAVELATAEFCWLLADDDLLKPRAVETVLRALRSDISLVLVNVEFMDFTLSKTIQFGVAFQSNRIYEPNEMDRLYRDAERLNGFVGSYVVRRTVWLERDRKRYFGSHLIHIGVIYQEQLPEKALVIARPLISMRMGNVHAWWPQHFNIFMNSRAVFNSLAVSAPTIERASSQPWESRTGLLWERAVGAYSFAEYRQQIMPQLTSARKGFFPLFVCFLPAKLVRVFLLIFLRVRRRPWRGCSPEWLIQVLRESAVQGRKDAGTPLEKRT